MRRIAIINQKGGCGKTTTAINLAGVFAARGKRTLLVDMDPQSHCAAGLAIPEQRIDLDVGDAMLHALPQRIDRARLLWRISRNLDLMPSRMKLAGIEASRGGLSEHTDRHTRLRRVLDTLLNDYDACCIDCPPSIGLLTFNALTAATEILIPVETSYFSLQGAAKQVATIRSLGKRLGARAEYWLVPTIHDESSALAKDLLEELKRRFGDRLVPVVIRSDAALREAASFGQPVIEYNPSSRGSEDYLALAQWLYARPGVSTAASDSGDASMARVISQQPTPKGMPAVTVTPIPRVERAMGARLSRGGHGGRGSGGSSPASSPITAPFAVPIASPITSSVSSSTSASPSEADALDGRPLVVSIPAGGGVARDSGGFPRAIGLVEPARPEYRQALTTAWRLRGIDSNRRVAKSLALELPDTDETPTAAHLPHGVTVLDREVVFVQPLGTGNRVSIAGDFNGWSPQAHVMHRDERRGVFEVRIPLVPGERHYRLVVDGRWTHDPYNRCVQFSPFGEKISVVEVAASSATLHSTPHLVAAHGAD